MPSNRVVRVHARRRGGRAVAARRDRADPARARGDAGLPARGGGGRRAAAAAARGCPTSTAPTSRSSPSTRRRRWTSTRRCTSSATATATSCTTRSPTSRRSSTPGDPVDVGGAPSAARRSTAPTPRSRCTRRCSPRARPRCCPTRCARPCSGRSTSTTTGEGTDVHVERARVRSTAQARLRAACSGRSTTARADESLHAAQGGRRAAARSARRPAAASRCRCPSRRSTSRATQWHAGVPRRCSRPRSWNAQISLLTGFAAASLMVYARVGLLRTLPPPDPRDVQRLHRTARALRHRLAGRAALPRLHPLASTRRKPAPRGDGHGLHPAAARQRVRRLRRRGARPTRSTPRWPRSTPTSPRRCAGSATATPARSASRCAPAPRCRTGCSTQLQRAARDACRTPAAAPHQYEAPSSTWSRPACSSDRVGETLRRRRRRRRREGRHSAAPSPSRTPRSRPGSPAPRPLPLGTDVEVRLTTADVATRKVEFTLVAAE